MNSTDSREAINNRLENALDGISQGLPAGQAQIVFNGTTWTQVSLTKAFNDGISLFSAVTAAHKALSSAILAREKALTGLLELLDGFSAATSAALGKSSPEVATFGVKPRKTPAKLTGPKLVARTAKSNATRRARGTVGKKAKAAIHGEPSTGTTPTPTPPPAK